MYVIQYSIGFDGEKGYPIWHTHPKRFETAIEAFSYGKLIIDTGRTDWRVLKEEELQK